MGDVAGSIRKVTLDGTTFDVMADANISETGSSTENTGLPTSGRTMKKMVRRVQGRESVVLACNAAERVVIEELADRVPNYPMSYETADGSVYRTTGFIEFENRETEENRATIQMIPVLKDGWSTFLAA